MEDWLDLEARCEKHVAAHKKFIAYYEQKIHEYGAQNPKRLTQDALDHLRGKSELGYLREILDTHDLPHWRLGAAQLLADDYRFQLVACERNLALARKGLKNYIQKNGLPAERVCNPIVVSLAFSADHFWIQNHASPSFLSMIGLAPKTKVD